MNKTNSEIIKTGSSQLAKKLRLLLQHRQISDNDIARELDISLMTIRRLISGKTTDPRISTIKMLADYLSVPIEILLEDSNELHTSQLNTVQKQLVPILDWTTAAKIVSIQKLDKSTLREWQLISAGNKYALSEEVFALESRPSMHARFPSGTIFIIDPKTKPIDGDMILIGSKKTEELSLREISMDIPKWKLLPLMPGSEILLFSEKEYKIRGVVILTMLYKRNK